LNEKDLFIKQLREAAENFFQARNAGDHQMKIYCKGYYEGLSHAFKSANLLSLKEILEIKTAIEDKYKRRYVSIKDMDMSELDIPTFVRNQKN